VVMGGRLLHPELTADVSGAAHAHSLQDGNVDLDEVAGCQLLKKQVQSHLRCAVLGFIKKSNFLWIILTMILLVSHTIIITVITDSDRVI